MKDTLAGAWPLILDEDYDIGIWNPHIRKLSLRNSEFKPSEADAIFRCFPNLDKLEAPGFQ